MTVKATITQNEELVSQKQEIENLQDKHFVINNLAITMLNLELSDPGLTDKCITLDPIKHKVFYDFFKEHIEQTRSGKKTRKCRFADSDNAIKTKINRYKENTDDEKFISFANEITDTLFKIMKTTTKSSGSFFILDAAYNEEDFIILLKLDPKDGVQLDTETLDLNKIENMLPESGDRVHKCALIKTQFIAGETNLFVLDRQQKAGETTKFFMQSFLQAIAIPNDNMKTVNALEEVYSLMEAKFPNADYKTISAAIEPEFGNGATVHLPETVENIYEKLIHEDEEDRDIKIEQYKSEFITSFEKKYKNYGLSFVVERDENKLFYTSKSNQIYFRYDKVLNETEVVIDHDKENDVYTIVISNNEDLKFKQDIR